MFGEKPRCELGNVSPLLPKSGHHPLDATCFRVIPHDMPGSWVCVIYL